MKPEIEIYIRPSGGRTLLSFNIPDSLKEQFIRGLNSGSFEYDAGIMSLEMDVFPEDAVYDAQRENLMKIGESIHIRRGITTVNIVIKGEG